MPKQPTALFIMGPTASGKTDLAVDLYLKYEKKARIISVDSALVYRHMNIGTAKPDQQLLAKAPHQLIDIIDPNQVYSAASFRKDALKELEHCVQNELLPIFVGGTSLYYRALEYGLSNLPEANPAIRQALEQERETLGLQAMHQRLASVDTVAAKRIHQNDPQRLMRALEVYDLTGKSLTELQQADQKPPLPFNIVKVVRAPKDRKVLHQRIEKRFKQMIKDGFQQEVEYLIQDWSLTATSSSMRAVGYRQMLMFLDGQLTHDEMIEKGIIATRQLAKRQLTWLRAEKKAHWLDENKDLLGQVEERLDDKYV